MGNGIFAEVNAALVHDFLHLKRHQHRQALRGEGSERVDFPRPDGQHRVQSIRLLILQRCHLAHVLSRRRQHRFRILIQLLLGVCGNHHCDHRKHHALVTGGQVVQKLFGLLALKLHVVGNHSGEIVVLILPSLPAGNVRFHAQQEAFHLADGLVGGNGNHIDGQHEVAVQFGQFREHAILDIAGVVLEEKHSGIFLAQLDMIRSTLYAVRADVVTEIMPQTRLPVHIKRECRLITGAIKVVENAQPLNGVQGHTLGTQIGEMSGQIRSDSRKICPCFLDVLLSHGDGNILFLRDAVCSGRLVQEHIVILLAVLIQPVLLHGHQDGFLKIRPVQPVIVDSDLRGSSAVQAVQKL